MADPRRLKLVCESDRPDGLPRTRLYTPEGEQIPHLCDVTWEHRVGEAPRLSAFMLLVHASTEVPLSNSFFFCTHCGRELNARQRADLLAGKEAQRMWPKWLMELFLASECIAMADLRADEMERLRRALAEARHGLGLSSPHVIPGEEG